MLIDLTDTRLSIIQTLGHCATLVNVFFVCFLTVETTLTWKVILRSLIFYICFYTIMVKHRGRVWIHMEAYFKWPKKITDLFSLTSICVVLVITPTRNNCIVLPYLFLILVNLTRVEVNFQESNNSGRKRKQNKFELKLQQIITHTSMTFPGNFLLHLWSTLMKKKLLK